MKIDEKVWRVTFTITKKRGITGTLFARNKKEAKDLGFCIVGKFPGAEIASVDCVAIAELRKEVTKETSVLSRICSKVRNLFGG